MPKDVETRDKLEKEGLIPVLTTKYELNIYKLFYLTLVSNGFGLEINYAVLKDCVKKSFRTNIYYDLKILLSEFTDLNK